MNECLTLECWRAVLARAAPVSAIAAFLLRCHAVYAAVLDGELARYNAFVARQAGDSIATMYAPDGELIGAGRRRSAARALSPPSWPRQGAR